jgi:hypothetical protein
MVTKSPDSAFDHRALRQLYRGGSEAFIGRIVIVRAPGLSRIIEQIMHILDVTIILHKLVRYKTEIRVCKAWL